MDPAVARGATPTTVLFEDGLGVRRQVFDQTTNETLELLCVRSELTAVPSFEFALRERVSRLANFRHGYYGRVRRVDRLTDPVSTLAIVSERTPGARLSEILMVAERRRLALDVNAALCLIRQLVPAVAMLHQNARDVAHGALGPERIVITPHARLVIVDYVLGAALEQLRYSHERYWKDFRIALPRSAGLPRFDHRADVTQIGIVALSLILGRPLRDDEYPAHIGEVVATASAMSALGGREAVTPALRSWIARALQIDLRSSFTSALEAQAALDAVLADESGYIAAPVALEAFLARYHSCAELPPEPTSMPGSPDVSYPAQVQAVPVPETRRPDQVASLNVQGSRLDADRPEASDLRLESFPLAHREPAPGQRNSRPSPEERAAQDLRAISETLSNRDYPQVQTFDAPHTAWPAHEPVRKSQPAVDVRRVETYTPPADRIEVAPMADPVAQTRGQVPNSFEAPSRPKAQRQSLTMDPPASEAARSMLPPPSSEVQMPEVRPEAPVKKPARNWRRWSALAAVLVAIVAGGIFAAQYYSSAAPIGASVGTLIVESNPPGAQVMVDGEARGMTPANLTLKAGPHVIELRGAGEPRVIPLTVPAGSQVSHYIELPQSNPFAGQLHVRTDPAGARITIDGQPRGISPLTIGNLQPGEHEVLLESDLGSVRQRVTIEAGAPFSLVVPLTAAPAGAPLSGWISVSMPVEVQLFENGQLLGTNRSDRIMVAAGRHEIEVANEALGYRTTHAVQVYAGRVAALALELPKGTMSLNATPWAEVWVDGQRVGETPIGNLSVSIGPHEVVFRHPELGEQRHATTVNLDAPARLSVDLTKK